MDSFSGRRDDPEDMEYGDDYVDEDFVDPDDLPVPSKEWREIDDYLEKENRKRRQKKRRREKHDKYYDGNE